MIVVIADDFSGAGEIAGIAWRYGLNSIINTELDLTVNADVIIIDTNSRSKSENDAGKIHESLAKKLNKSNTDWIYKKTDSVLRGHIVTEIDSLNSVLKKKKVILIANNPSTEKIIKNNTYYIEDVKLSQTDFQNDPDFPARLSKVDDILGPQKNLAIKSINSPELIDGDGLFVPDISKEQEIDLWAASVNNDILPAGSSDFFEALLKMKGLNPVDNPKEEVSNQKKKRLFVFASTAKLSRETVLKLKDKMIPICSLPCEPVDALDLTKDCLDHWVDDIKTSFEKNQMVVSAVLKPVVNSPGFPQQLNQFISKMIENIIASISLDELLIEGGATVSHFIRSVGWKEFTVMAEYAKGIVVLNNKQQPGLRLIVKPGSYAWPEEILKK
jgi:uncharacterized protein YgbK (DUF1537 family)